MRSIVVILFLGFIQWASCQVVQEQKSTPRLSSSIKQTDNMCGLSFVAPPRPFELNPMEEVQEIGADWIAVIPYAYTRLGKPSVRYNINEGWQQWWGERPEGVKKTIALAHENNIKVMLKPQVYIPGSWPGDLSFDTEEDWQAWEADYEAYILSFAKMADSMDVTLFCIGTEFKKSVVQRELFWRKLILKIKECYKGRLTYAANWDEYKEIPFWDALDYIGIDAYFPLVDAKTPTVAQLKKAWLPYQKEIKTFCDEKNKSALFTEVGYLSVDRCAYNTWELEAKVKRLPINERAQANALDAMFEVFWDEPYWAGSFIWKWFPHGHGHEGYIERDYTPQHKEAAKILKKWHQTK